VGERGELTGCSKGGVQRDCDVRGPENNGLAVRSGVLDMRDAENDVLLSLLGLVVWCGVVAAEDVGRLRLIRERLDAEGGSVGFGGAALWSIIVEAAGAELSERVEISISVDV
jgi:hypothetical protein